MSESAPSPFSLPTAEVALRQRRYTTLAAQMKDIQRELADLQRWFDAVRVIFPSAAIPEFVIGTPTTEIAPPKQRDWGEIVYPYIRNAPNGIAPKEIVEAIEASDDEEAKERTFQNPNGHHSGLERLLARKEVVRYSGRYYEPAVYQRLVDSGEIEYLNKISRQDGIFAYTLDIVKKSGRSLPNEVINKLREHEEYRRMLSRNPQYGYTVLSRLVKRGFLIKDRAHYVAAPQENEPSDVQPSNGSDAVSDDLI